MQGLGILNTPMPFNPSKKLPLSAFTDALPSCPTLSRKPSLRCRVISRCAGRNVRVQASNVSIGSGGYEDSEENKNKKIFPSDAPSDSSSEIEKHPVQIPYPLSVGLVPLGCALVFALIAFVKGGPSALLAAIAKSGFTAAFSLIFVSEIGDKTFFIAALLAMQYDKVLVLLGSTGALSLMTVLSVIIGRIFNSVPAQFQTTLPIGEYAAVTLLLFFGLKSIKDAWDLPSSDVKSGDKSSPELGEYTEAEELVKEKVSKRLTNPLEIVWKSFTLVFVAISNLTTLFLLLGMGRSLNARHDRSRCCAVSMGRGKWSHCWTRTCDIYCCSRRGISCQLHFRKTGWLRGRWVVPSFCSSHIFRSFLKILASEREREREREIHQCIKRKHRCT